MEKPIAITCGDPAGVGPELIETVLSRPLGLAAPLVVIGPESWIASCRFDPENRVETIAVGGSAFAYECGTPSDAAARIALEAMEIAAAGCVEGRFGSVATGPISKANCAKVGFRFPGQTEFFASRWGGEPSMSFVGDRLKVVLATWHIPLKQVAGSLDFETVAKAAMRADELCRRLGIEQPKIAVCGLNPHAGEGGLLGSEERDGLDPILDGLRERIPGLSACLPGDTVFGRVMKGEFDVAVAMYHDQGLAPLKAVDFDTAVNVSLGLNHLRTSPDHGTAYAIAGKGIASANSFERAIRLADRL